MTKNEWLLLAFSNQHCGSDEATLEMVQRAADLAERRWPGIFEQPLTTDGERPLVDSFLDKGWGDYWKFLYEVKAGLEIAVQELACRGYGGLVPVQHALELVNERLDRKPVDLNDPRA